MKKSISIAAILLMSVSAFGGTKPPLPLDDITLLRLELSQNTSEIIAARKYYQDAVRQALPEELIVGALNDLDDLKDQRMLIRERFVDAKRAPGVLTIDKQEQISTLEKEIKRLSPKIKAAREARNHRVKTVHLIAAIQDERELHELIQKRKDLENDLVIARVSGFNGQLSQSQNSAVTPSAFAPTLFASPADVTLGLNEIANRIVRSDGPTPLVRTYDGSVLDGWIASHTAQPATATNPNNPN